MPLKQLKRLFPNEQPPVACSPKTGPANKGDSG